VPRKLVNKESKPRQSAHADNVANVVTDERVRRSKENVLKITAELLYEGGLGGVSVDEVSRRSGVAKTTIYRHWPTRSDLVLDACAQMSASHDVPDTGSLEGDIRTLLTGIAEMLTTANWSAVLPSIMDAAERDPNIAKIHSDIQKGHAAPFHAVISRAVQKGALPKTVDPKIMTAALLGPLFYRRWFSREPLDKPFVDGIINTTMAQF
jgi:AcrR family transcriptional regulator